jgi:Holliday junction resolvase RusA-like endonuclease
MFVYFPSKNRSDPDNVMKVTLDSLTGVIWKDDRQIKELHVYKEHDKKKPARRVTRNCPGCWAGSGKA